MKTSNSLEVFVVKLVLAAFILSSPFCWAGPQTCLGKSKVGVIKDPVVKVEIDPDENPLKTAKVSFNGVNEKFLLEIYGRASQVEDYVLHDEKGELLAGTLHYFRRRHRLEVWDHWKGVLVSNTTCPKK